jgi:RimJ/RimL family protein N-acetyltransferase
VEGALRLEPLRTARLALVPFDEATARAVLEGDLDAVRAGEGWPHAGTANGIGMALARGAPLPWMVLHDAIVIGDCGLHGPPDEHGEVEIGYGLAAPYRGKGYGSELVRAISDWLLRRLAVRSVRATTAEDNRPSRRALERSGFALTAPPADGQVRYRREA